MANRKVVDLPELTTLSNDDELYIIDISDLTESSEGTSKKIKALNFVPAGGESISNKQNSLAVDGTNTKYPTVTAVNIGLASKAHDANTLHKTGDETKSGKLNLSNVNLYLVPSPIFSGLTDTGVAGNLNGLYYYSVNYYNALGETDTSGEQSISVTNKQVSVTLPISPNTSVIGRRLYRTVANAFDPVIKYLVADIPNNTATSYVDNIIDGSLGVPVPRVNTTGGQLFNNNDRVGFASGGTTSFGLNSALQSTGYANSSFGFGSLTDNTTGYRNTAGGVFSLYKNTTGYNNTGWGVHSLNDNTTGWDNSAFGFSALISNTTGTNNASFGSFSNSSNSTGSYISAFGNESLQYNTASNVSAFGYGSGKRNTTGTGGTFIGSKAGEFNTTGNNNTIIGDGSGKANTVSGNNSLVGFQSGFNGASFGNSNSFFGSFSGYNATGSGSVFLGSGAGYFETGSNKLFIDNTTRANEGEARVQALIYGEFNASTDNQQLNVNGKLNVLGLSKFNTRLQFNNANQFVGDGSMSTSNTNDFGFRNDLGKVFLASGGATPQFTLNTDGSAVFTSSVTSTSLNLSTAPTTSAGTYDILTRNTSTGVVEKVASNDFQKITTAVLTADQSNSTTTLTKVTGLDKNLDVGTYQYKYMVRYQSSTTATGVRFSVNHSGTTSFFLGRITWTDVASQGSTAQADQDAVTGSGVVIGSFAARAKSTTGWGTTIFVDTANADMMMIIEGTFEVTASGNIELWHGSETADTTTVKTGSSLVITKVN